jgi:hypothetical protein
MIDHATQGKAREGSDGCSSAGAGVRWATLGAPLRCVRAIVRGAGMSHGGRAGGGQDARSSRQARPAESQVSRERQTLQGGPGRQNLLSRPENVR